MSHFNELNDLIRGYVKDEKHDFPYSLSTKLVYNSNIKENRKQVFYTLKEYIQKLDTNDTFYFSVAFITESGLSLLKTLLKELEIKNIKGKILTSDYLTFTEPKALEELANFKNIEIKMYQVDQQIGFHTKGYLFKYKDFSAAIIGSSNMTAKALTTNIEWNNLIVGDNNSEVFKNLFNEFDFYWENKNSIYINEIIESYKEKYNNSNVDVVKSSESKSIEFTPNLMQNNFIQNLNNSINQGQDKGLLISATGTGKTYASAFGVKNIKNFKVKKLLFITHRQVILSQAEKTYKNVFKEEIKTAFLTGNTHSLNDANYIFATVNTISKNEYLKTFKPDEFDVIIIDECHRINHSNNNETQTMYQRVLNYFKPKFLLGMSATPERSDGYDIFSDFNHNVLNEIRLEDALESNILVPFHYFGIKDIEIQGQSIKDNESFTNLVCDERVTHILENSKYYSYSGNKLKCLMFVSTREEGKQLSEKINANKEYNIHSVFMDGTTRNEEREKNIHLLEEEDINKPHLDMIITVDIFNEGVDIPSVNQIILLRPTESSIIFLQQLGRGLRHSNSKEYLTVIDFIGNYKNNFIILDALNNKSSGLRKIFNPNVPLLPFGSIVQFDEISEKKIIESIAKNYRSDFKQLKEQYLYIKAKLGRIPSIIEFDSGYLSGRYFMDLGREKSYYQFLRKVENDYDKDNSLNQKEIETLNYLSLIIGNGMRNYEALLLQYLLNNKNEDDFFQDSLLIEFNQNERKLLHKSLLAILSTQFNKKDKSPELIVPCKEIDNLIVLTDELKKCLKKEEMRKHINWIIEYSLYSYSKYFNHPFNQLLNFNLYEKYTRKDVCRLINHTKNEESTIYGYKSYEDLNITPIFVTYHKNLDENDSTNYKDCFLDQSTFLWDSKSNRNIDSKDVQQLIKINKNNGKTLLFVKRNDNNDDGSHYFLGEVKILEYKEAENSGTKVVKFKFHLLNTVRDDIYSFLINKPADL